MAKLDNIEQPTSNVAEAGEGERRTSNSQPSIGGQALRRRVNIQRGGGGLGPPKAGRHAGRSTEKRRLRGGGHACTIE